MLHSMDFVSALLALWRLEASTGCPSPAGFPRGQHREHHLSVSPQLSLRPACTVPEGRRVQ